MSATDISNSKLRSDESDSLSESITCWRELMNESRLSSARSSACMASMVDACADGVAAEALPYEIADNTAAEHIDVMIVLRVMVKSLYLSRRPISDMEMVTTMG